MPSIYLSAATPRWSPSTEDDLRAAAQAGLLEESHYLDLKRELKDGKGANRETARDAASFAVDSGTLIVGLEENGDGAITLAPQPLAGLAERVEQIARTIPDPPLPVLTTVIRSDADPELGYLLVHIPPSPAAPHMVDGRYFGRGDKTKHHLPDPEVRRLHERQRNARADALTALDAYISRDPTDPATRERAHLFLVAEPTPGREGMLLDLVAASDWVNQLVLFTRQAVTGLVQERLREISLFSPDLDAATTAQRRPAGVALASYVLRSDRTIRDDLTPASEEDVVELEVDEDGGLRVLCGRLSDNLRSAQGQVLFDAAAVLYAYRLVALATTAAERAGYFGNWALALGATGLRGLYSFDFTQQLISRDPPRYPDDDYRATTITTYAELTSTPGAVVNRLVGRLLRALGTADSRRTVLEDPPAPTPQPGP